MDEKNEPVDEYTQRLLYAREPLIKTIIKVERNLKKVSNNRLFQFYLISGLGNILVGLFFLWLVAAGVVTPRTLVIILPAGGILPAPMFFGLLGFLFILCGFALLVGPTHVRICYPSKLNDLKQILENLDEFVRCPQNLRKEEQAIQILHKLERHLGSKP